MIVANPMYDTIFKYLMEENSIAKGLISRIIEEEIIDLQHAPQEETVSRIDLKYSHLGIKHQDYVAVIKKTNGEHYKVAIEVQKSYIVPKVAAFRTYIAEKYKKPTVIDGNDNYLPIKTIYFIEEVFNDKLPSVLKINREYIDVLNHKKYKGEEDPFVNQMTHEAYFIQTGLVPPDLENDITRVLNFFTRKFHIEIPKDKELSKSEKRKIARRLNIPDELLDKITDKLFSKMLTRLYGADKDPEVQINVELSQKYEDQREAEQERIRLLLEQNKKDIEHKDQVIEQNKQVIEQNKQVIEHKDQVIEQNKQALINSAKAMLQAGISIEQVQTITNLSLTTLKNLIK